MPGSRIEPLKSNKDAFYAGFRIEGSTEYLGGSGGDSSVICVRRGCNGRGRDVRTKNYKISSWVVVEISNIAREVNCSYTNSVRAIVIEIDVRKVP